MRIVFSSSAILRGFLSLCFLVAMTAQALAGGETAARPLNNLVAFTPQLVRALISVSDDRRSLTFRVEGRYEDSRLAMIVRGSLLLAPAGSRFPDGFAVRVTDLRRQPGLLTVVVDPVTMTDLLETREGTTKQITVEDVEEVEIEEAVDREGIPVTEALRPMRNTQVLACAAVSPQRRMTSGEAMTETAFHAAEEGFTHRRPLLEADKRKSTWARVRDAAVFSSGVRFEWAQDGIVANACLRVEQPKIVFKRDQLSFSGTIRLDAGVGFQPAANLSFKQILLRLKLKPILLGMLGPVPLYVRPRIRVLIKGRVTGSIGCSGSFSVSAPFVTGATRGDHGWQSDSQCDVSVTPRGIALDGTVGQLNAKVFTGVAVDFFINDIAGPTLRTGIYFSPTAAATLLQTSESGASRHKPVLSLFKLKGGAELSIGGALSFLENARFLIDVVRVEVPLYKLKLAGIRVDPQKMRAETGGSLSLDRVRLIPLYRQTLLEENREPVAVGSLPADWGIWSPKPRVDGQLCLSNSRSGETFHVGLATIDQGVSIASATFELLP